MSAAVIALWRAHDGADWAEFDLVGLHPSGRLVLRERGRLYPGVFLADRTAVRVPASDVAFNLPHRSPA